MGLWSNQVWQLVYTQKAGGSNPPSPTMRKTYPRMKSKKISKRRSKNIWDNFVEGQGGPDWESK